MSILPCNSCGTLMDTDEWVDGFVVGHPDTPSYDTGAWLCETCLDEYVKNHCLSCHKTMICYECASGSGPGVHLAREAEGGP